MKKWIVTPIAIISTGLISVGCATKGDVSNLQTQIDGQNYQISEVRNTANEALGTARTADRKASRALSLVDQKRKHGKSRKSRPRSLPKCKR